MTDFNLKNYQRKYIDIMVVHVNGLTRIRGSSRDLDRDIREHSITYTKLTASYDAEYEQVLEKYKGADDLSFRVPNRIEYLREKATDLSKSILRVILGISDIVGEISRHDLKFSILKEKFDKVLHDVGNKEDGEWKNTMVYGEDINRSTLPPLPRFNLSSKQYKIIGKPLKKVGLYQAKIEAFKQIDKALRALGTVEFEGRKEKVKSVSALAEKLCDELSEEYIRENLTDVVQEARDQYIVEARPDYRIDDTAYYQALYQSLRRKLEND